MLLLYCIGTMGEISNIHTVDFRPPHSEQRMVGLTLSGLKLCVKNADCATNHTTNSVNDFNKTLFWPNWLRMVITLSCMLSHGRLHNRAATFFQHLAFQNKNQTNIYNYNYSKIWGCFFFFVCWQWLLFPFKSTTGLMFILWKLALLGSIPIKYRNVLLKRKSLVFFFSWSSWKFKSHSTPCWAFGFQIGGGVFWSGL